MSWVVRAQIALAFVPMLAAEVDMPRGLFRGTLEAVIGSKSLGTILARAADGTVNSCAYDSRTYMEIDNESVSAMRLRVGDPIKVVADHRGGSVTCYARMLQVVVTPPVSPRRRPVVHATPPPPTRIRGDRTISGRVVAVDDHSITLRTHDEDVTIALRKDTQVLGEQAVAMNQYVSVRAGRTLQGVLEAYQVSWAEMLKSE